MSITKISLLRFSAFRGQKHRQPTLNILVYTVRPAEGCTTKPDILLVREDEQETVAVSVTKPALF